MGRHLRTLLDRLHPTYETNSPQAETGHTRSFLPGDRVYAHNCQGDPRWVPGVITQVTGSCSYRVRLDDGRQWRCHIDQLQCQVLQHQPAAELLPNRVQQHPKRILDDAYRQDPTLQPWPHSDAFSSAGLPVSSKRVESPVADDVHHPAVEESNRQPNFPVPAQELKRSGRS